MAGKTRLLLVEDEDLIRAPLATFLADEGYEVETAENGIEALNSLRERSYDLIILDMKMPYIDGSQLSKILQDEKIRTPVLVITAVDNQSPVHHEIARILKPFSFKQVQTAIRQHFQGGK